MSTLRTNTLQTLDSLHTVQVADIATIARDMISVKDFGAVCDGVTNDSTALFNANAAAVAQKKPLLIIGTMHVPTATTVTAEIVPTNSQIFSLTSNVTINNGSPIRPEWWGANATTDSRAAVAKAAISTATGGVLKLSQKYPVIGAGTEVLLLTKPISVVGTGIAYSGFHVKTGTPVSTDIIRISPDMALSDGEGYSLDNFAITSDSIAIGRHAVNLDITRPEQHLKNLWITKCRFERLTGKGIVTTNPALNYASVFTTTVRDCVIVNGIDFTGAGDSLRVEDCTITGIGWGVVFDLIPGANKPMVTGCNITSKAGGVYVKGPTDCVITNNNIEALSVNDGGFSAFVVIAGTPGSPARNNIISGNIFGMLADGAVPRVTTAVVVDYADHTIITENQFNRAIPASQTAFSITANARYTCVGMNNDGNAALDTGYFNGGFDTRGTYNLDIPATGFSLYNSSGNWDDLRHIKDPTTNMVSLYGAVSKNGGGAWTDAVPVLILPAGCRPKLSQWKTCSALETSVGYVSIQVRIDGNGQVLPHGVTGRSFTWLSLSGTSFPGYQ